MRMSATVATVLTLMITISANAATITLKAGDYGSTGLACDKQPNATTMSFDGRNFSYAHASKCTDKIVGRAAGIMAISETCRALGDGTPAAPDTQTFKLRQQGAERFALIKGRSTTSFRRCGSLGYFNKH